MADTDPIRAREAAFYVLNMRTRFPFRYGIASLTALPHVFVEMTVEVAGAPQVGVASEGLAPKWFTKNPTTAFAEDLADMFEVLRFSADALVQIGAAPNVFSLWRDLHASVRAWGRARGWPDLLLGLGESLMERALIDALCRHRNACFADAARANLFGVDLAAVHPELTAGPGAYLPADNPPSVTVRHTVGLGDPLREEDIADDARVRDGLPLSLQANVRAYGLTHFKIKLSGDAEADADRLERVFDAIRAGGASECRFTLDGNEQYPRLEAFREAWRRFRQSRSLADAFQGLLFVEQPAPRDVSLGDEAAAAMGGWHGRPPIIIDESDSGLTTARQALALGYAGTSHKNCKGVLKGMANACLAASRNRQSGSTAMILSSEDLGNVGPVALLQDLAALHAFGIRHSERNGHHYFAGLSMFPDDWQAMVLAAHGDLYRRSDAGFATARIESGRLRLRSVVQAPFGLRPRVDPSRFEPLSSWRPESLEA